MTSDAVIKIPLPPRHLAKEVVTEWNYKRRPIQKEIHALLDEYRFSVLVAHRRMGKTVLAVNQMILRAVKDRVQDGIYAYVAPFRNQAKKVAWKYLKRFTQCLQGRHVNESDLIVTLPGGIQLIIIGADNPDALRGLYFDGIVLDEVAQMRREVWTEIIRPALADHNGWAVFIGTPKGPNLFHELYLQAQDDTTGEWTAMMYRAPDTNALPEDELEKIRAEIGDNAYRQEFLCDFTASSEDNLITIDEATEAIQRVYMPNDYLSMPSVFGVDVARFGNDRSVVIERQGLVAKSPIVLEKADNVTVADRILSLYHQHKPQYIFVDAGQGQGVIDILRRQLNCVIEVPFGSTANDSGKYANRRSEMWFLMREWIRHGGQIPNIPDLVTELSAPTYSFSVNGKIQLEKKDDIKKRIGRSPDYADALALTFAQEVLPRFSARQMYADTDDNPLYGFYEAPRQLYADGTVPSLF